METLETATGLDHRIDIIEEAPLRPGYPGYPTIQSCINSVVAGTSIEIFVPRGTYTEQLTMQADVKLIGEGQRDTIIQSAAGDVVTFPSGSVGGIQMEDLTLRSLAGGGACAKQTANLSTPYFKNLLFLQDNAAQMLWNTPVTAGYLISANFDHCTFTRASDASVAGISWISDNGEINKNIIGGGSTLNDAGSPSAPFIVMEEQSVGSLMGGNVLRDINAENCRAGILRALSQFIITVENVHCYDLAGVTLADLFYFGKSSVGSLRTRFPILKNVSRIGATGLGGGFSDVKFVASECDYPHIEDSEHSSLSTGYTVDLGPNIGATFRLRNGVTVNNLDFNADGVFFGRGSAHNQIGQLVVSGKRTIHHSTVPSTGTWSVGDRCINSAGAVGQPKAWYCTVAGTSGTWVSEGNL